MMSHRASLVPLILLACLALAACAPKAANSPAVPLAASTATAEPPVGRTVSPIPTTPTASQAALPAARVATLTLAVTQTPPNSSPAPATATPLPSFTPTEVSPLALTLAAPAATPGVKASAAPSALAELAYQRLFRDGFEDASKGWVLSEGMEIKGGALRLWTGSRDINAVVVPLAEHTQADVSVKAEIQVVKWDGASSLMFGAGCRMNETSYDQYMFFVGPLGKDKAMLQMVKFKGGKLVQMTDLPQIFNLPHSIQEKPVPFEFICQGERLSFKVGAETIATLTDAEYTAGSVDLFIMGADKQASAAFDQVEVSQVKEK